MFLLLYYFRSFSVIFLGSLHFKQFLYITGGIQLFSRETLRITMGVRFLSTETEIIWLLNHHDVENNFFQNEIVYSLSHLSQHVILIKNQAYLIYI